MTTSVLVVDDQPIVQEGIASTLHASGQFHVVGFLDSPEGIVEAYRALCPEILMLDIEMGEKHPFETLRRVKEMLPSARVLAYGPQSETDVARVCRRAGADAYASKRGSLLGALSRLAEGRSYPPPRRRRGYKISGLPYRRLTSRELEIFLCIGRGMSTGETARYLNLRPNSVSVMLGRIRRKTGLQTPSEIVLHALAHQLVNPEGPWRRVVMRPPEPDRIEAFPLPAALLAPDFEIQRVNTAWMRSIRQTGTSPSPVERWAPGANFLDSCPDVEGLRDYYRERFEAAPALDSREIAVVHTFERRTDSRFQLVEVHAYRTESREILLVFETTIDRDQDFSIRVPCPPAPSRYENDEGSIEVCANCRQVRRPGSDTWDFVPEWIETPEIPTHASFCKVCLQVCFRGDFP